MTSVTNHFWWQAEKGRVHERLLQHVRALEEEQSYVHDKNLKYARLYGNEDLLGYSHFAQRTAPASKERSSYNIVQQASDTAVNNIAKNRPKLTFLTDGQEFSVQRRAKKLEQLVIGIFDQSNLYQESIRVFRDACVFGTGALKIYADPGTHQIRTERVLIDEIIVDQRECLSSSQPRQLHQRKFVNREVLKALYPDFISQIERAGANTGNRWNDYCQLPAHELGVVESWHLPSVPGAKDGRHVISIEGADLLDEPWTENDFPFVFLRWRERLNGFYGQGIAEIIAGHQRRINKLLKFIDRCQDLIAVPRVFVDVASKVSKQALSNDISTISYRGRPPTFHTPQALTAEIYSYLEVLKRDGFDEVGVSRLNAHQTIPSGLETGAAVREFHDIGSDRQSVVALAYEDLFKQAGKKVVRLARELNKGRSFTSVFRGRNAFQRIDWKKVALDDNQFEIKIGTSSLFTLTPSARVQTVTDWLSAGMITPEEGRRLLDHPDLQRSTDLATAAIEDIEATIENLLDGIFEPPEPFQNLQLGIQLVQQAYLKARRDQAGEDILQLLRDWIENATELLQPQAQAPTETQFGPEGAVTQVVNEALPGTVAPPTAPVDPAQGSGPAALAGGLPPELLAQSATAPEPA